MNEWIAICAATVFLVGCSFTPKQSLYEVRLTSGERLYAVQKPNLDDDYYVFTDMKDQEYRINRPLVLYVEPTEFER